jgi:hypothetical protein
MSQSGGMLSTAAANRSGNAEVSEAAVESMAHFGDIKNLRSYKRETRFEKRSYFGDVVWARSRIWK